MKVLKWMVDLGVVLCIGWGIYSVLASGDAADGGEKANTVTITITDSEGEERAVFCAGEEVVLSAPAPPAPPAPCPTDCSGCPDTITVTISGLSGSGPYCPDCGDVDGSYECTRGGADSCTWQIGGAGMGCIPPNGGITICCCGDCHSWLGNPGANTWLVALWNASGHTLASWTAPNTTGCPPTTGWTWAGGDCNAGTLKIAPAVGDEVDGDGLTYTWSIKNTTTGKTFDDTGQKITFTDTATPGKYSATVTVTDSGGIVVDSGTADFTVVGVSFEPDPVTVGVAKETTVTPAISPASAIPLISFAAADTTIATVTPTTVTNAGDTLTVRGIKKGVTTLTAKLSDKVCGCVTISVGPGIDFVRITPDPGFLAVDRFTTFTAIGFAKVEGKAMLPRDFSPDPATAIGTEVTFGETAGIFLGPVKGDWKLAGKTTRILLGPVKGDWKLAGGKNSDAFFRPDSATKNVSTVQLSRYGERKLQPGLLLFDGEAENAKLQGVKITFSKEEVRPGVPNARNDTVTATIVPNNVDIKFETSDKKLATVAPAQGKGIVNLTIDGIALSKANQDSELRAVLNGKIHARIPITVVKPDDYSSASPVVDRVPAIGGAPNKVIWIANVTITILDQFGIGLGANWNGIIITESINGAPQCGFTPLNPNGEPLNNGTITDPASWELTCPNARLANLIVIGQLLIIAPVRGVTQEIFAAGIKLNGVNNRTKDMTRNVWTVTNSH